jgi:hypothetical protein
VLRLFICIGSGDPAMRVWEREREREAEQKKMLAITVAY